MAQTIRDVMTFDPVALAANASLTAAARQMKLSDIGDVIVVDQNQVCGMVTDRDIVVRALAEGRDPSTTTLAEICSREVACLQAEDSVQDAVRLMRERAVRRLPVVDRGRPVGIVSIGDLAIDLDSESALATISAAPPST
jgi:CBS domain-containing protein